MAYNIYGCCLDMCITASSRVSRYCQTWLLVCCSELLLSGWRSLQLLLLLTVVSVPPLYIMRIKVELKYDICSSTTSHSTTSNLSGSKLKHDTGMHGDCACLCNRRERSLRSPALWCIFEAVLGTPFKQKESQHFLCNTPNKLNCTCDCYTSAAATSPCRQSSAVVAFTASSTYAT